MDTLLWSAGYRTHLKIVVVSLVASIVVVLVGLNAPFNAPIDRQAAVARDQTGTAVVKAGASKHYSENTQSRIR
jgi:hypothetical protein